MHHPHSHEGHTATTARANQAQTTRHSHSNDPPSNADDTVHGDTLDQKITATATNVDDRNNDQTLSFSKSTAKSNVKSNATVTAMATPNRRRYDGHHGRDNDQEDSSHDVLQVTDQKGQETFTPPVMTSHSRQGSTEDSSSTPSWNRSAVSHHNYSAPHTPIASAKRPRNPYSSRRSSTGGVSAAGSSSKSHSSSSKSHSNSTSHSYSYSSSNSNGKNRILRHSNATAAAAAGQSTNGSAAAALSSMDDPDSRSSPPPRSSRAWSLFRPSGSRGEDHVASNSSNSNSGNSMGGIDDINSVSSHGMNSSVSTKKNNHRVMSHHHHNRSGDHPDDDSTEEMEQEEDVLASSVMSPVRKMKLVESPTLYRVTDAASAAVATPVSCATPESAAAGVRPEWSPMHPVRPVTKFDKDVILPVGHNGMEQEQEPERVREREQEQEQRGVSHNKRLEVSASASATASASPSVLKSIFSPVLNFLHHGHHHGNKDANQGGPAAATAAASSSLSVVASSGGYVGAGVGTGARAQEEEPVQVNSFKSSKSQSQSQVDGDGDVYMQSATTLDMDPDDEEEEGDDYGHYTAATTTSATVDSPSLQRHNHDEISEQDQEDVENIEEEFNPYLFMKYLPPYETVVPYPQHKICLPPKDPSDPPISLVLDLDETLVHCTVEPISDADMTFPVLFNGMQYKVHVRIRPYLMEFLEAVHDKFEVIVFTASQEVYANELLNRIDPEKKYIKHRMFREACLLVEGNYLKDLNVLGRDLSQAVLVDNSPHAFGYQINNGIPIESWFDDPNDTELLKLEQFCSTLHGVKDVRTMVRSKFQTYKLIRDA